MKKDGQVTLFFILGVIVFIIVMFFLFIGSISVETRSETNKKLVESIAYDGVPIRAHIENCVAQKLEYGLFDYIGLNGGHLNVEIVPNRDVTYGENTFTVPIFTDMVPTIEEMEAHTSAYINAHSADCINLSQFSVSDVITIEQQKRLKNSISINYDDVDVEIDYPVTIKKRGKTNTIMKDFHVNMPIRLGYINASVTRLMQGIDTGSETDPYNLSEHCDDLMATEETLVKIIRFNDTLPGNTHLIRYLDYHAYLNETFVNHIHKPFVFQFALENVYIDGDCYY